MVQAGQQQGPVRDSSRVQLVRAVGLVRDMQLSSVFIEVTIETRKGRRKMLKLFACDRISAMMLVGISSKIEGEFACLLWTVLS